LKAASIRSHAILSLLSLAALLFQAQHVLAAPSNHFQKTMLIAVSWGAQPGKFGRFVPPDGEIIGPRTFALADNGAIFIFDTVKHNIKHFGADGRFLRSIGKNLFGYALAWHDGFLYLLDGEALRKYDTNGRQVGVYPISPAIRLHEGYGQWLRVTDDDALYVKSGRKAYRIFSDLDEEVIPPDLQDDSERIGTPNRQGNRWYRLIRQSDQRRLLQIQDAGGRVLQEIVLETADRFGNNYFLEEDIRGNVYLEIQQIDAKDRIRLNVWVLDRQGERIAELSLPNRYHTIVFKKILVDGKGAIYHLRTEPDGVYIDKWVWKGLQ
jgi:hypothetical protein